LGDIRQKRVPGLEAVEKYNKLMILGSREQARRRFSSIWRSAVVREVSGAARSHLCHAERVCRGERSAKFVDLSRSIGVAHRDRAYRTPTDHLVEGRSLILLDGLDEVRDTDSSRVLRDIQQFADLFRDNQIVITCRIAARDYTFQRFTEVEVADFDETQIADFVEKWFACKKDEVKGEQFLQKLKKTSQFENWRRVRCC
jgi:predicted NACHT family NTPase